MRSAAFQQLVRIKLFFSRLVSSLSLLFISILALTYAMLMPILGVPPTVKLISLLDQALVTVKAIEPTLMNISKDIVKQIEKALDERDIHAPAITHAQLQATLASSLVPILEQLKLQAANTTPTTATPPAAPLPAGIVYVLLFRGNC